MDDYDARKLRLVRRPVILQVPDQTGQVTVPVLFFPPRPRSAR